MKDRWQEEHSEEEDFEEDAIKELDDEILNSEEGKLKR